MSTLAVPRLQWVGKAARRTAGAHWAMIVASIYLLILAVVAGAAPWIAPHDPSGVDLSAVSAGSTSGHLLGTDELGRDVLSRVIWGARTSLAGPLFVVIVGTVVGTTVAITCAWRGGHFDSFATAIIDVLLGFPGLLLAILAVALFGAGLLAPAVALSVAYAPYFARVTRSVALREKSQIYTAALTVQGYSGLRVCVRHLLPNIFPLILAQAAILFGYAIVDLAAISYLGLGVQPPTPDWGSMVSVGQDAVLQGRPEVALSAGAVIVVTVVAFNIVGEWLADRSAHGRR
jgi:peptide/nickel transport system permease protein